jgi:hypothetical protein
VGEEFWEPNPTAMAAAELVRDLDPEHPRLYVGWGGFDVDEHLRLFADGADVLAADYYPIAGGSIAETHDVARRTSAVARQSAREAAIVLQAFSWSSEPTLKPPGITGRWPTTSEMRRMRDHAWLGGSFGLMLWFDYYFVKPLGSTSIAARDRLAAALRAPYPLKVAQLSCRNGTLRWQQSRRGRVVLQGRDARGRWTRRLRGGGHGIRIGRLGLPAGRTTLRVIAGRDQRRSVTNRVVVRSARGHSSGSC